MSDARHSPPGDDSFRASLLRNGLGAVGLVVIVAAAFWAIGTLGTGDVTPTGSDAPEPDVAAPADDAGTDAGEESATDGDEPADEVEHTAEATDAGDGTDADDTAPEEEPEPDPEPEPEPEPEPDEPAETEQPDDGAAEPAVPPGEVTVQVLDGVKDDGGAAADEVAEALEGAGYDIIARNDALSYDVTTVLYNPGQVEAAEQIAAELGGAEVREQPGNLSSAVDVHVVVGRDRA